MSYVGVAVLAVLALACAGVVGLLAAKDAGLRQAASVEAAPARLIDLKVPYVPRLTIIGDSYVAGSNMGGKGEKNWVDIIRAKIVGNDKRLDLTVTGLPGSGYVSQGLTSRSFVNAGADPIQGNSDVIVVFGSRNDMTLDPAQVGRNAATTYASLKKTSPQAKLIVVGPPWVDESVPDEVLTVRDQVKTAAIKAGAQFIDPLDAGWFTGSKAALIGSDNVHPTDEGHAYMASLLAKPITAAVEKARAAHS